MHTLRWLDWLSAVLRFFFGIAGTVLYVEGMVGLVYNYVAEEGKGRDTCTCVTYSLVHRNHEASTPHCFVDLVPSTSSFAPLTGIFHAPLRLCSSRSPAFTQSVSLQVTPIGPARPCPPHPCACCLHIIPSCTTHKVGHILLSSCPSSIMDAFSTLVTQRLLLLPLTSSSVVSKA